MTRYLKLMLFISMIIFIFTAFSFSNEKDSNYSKFSFFSFNDKNNQNRFAASGSGYLNNLDYYASGSGSSDINQKRFGIALMAAGGGTLGLFYFLGIIATAASWALVDKSKSDDVPWGASIGVSFIPLVGLYIVPYFAYQAFTNDGEQFGSAQQASTAGTVAACIIVNFFQLAGFVMLIAGAVLYATSSSKTAKSGRVALLYYSERKLNYATYKYNDNMTMGVSFKL